MKEVVFTGNTLEVIKRFPLDAKKEAGHQLDQVQRGRDPDDWKPFNSVGVGVKEIRIKEKGGVFRVMYIAKYADFIYVLHAFKKKTQKTEQKDIDLSRQRLKEIKP
ncbi:type II toxin-antitoxin system RelE/ParE family toxin [Cardiobacterium sp. AH-315-I02]|nr:type II toxin-antitoxin system RelE/ParE family toxin [Cardiobacterium sp. AH-315-I02]